MIKVDNTNFSDIFIFLNDLRRDLTDNKGINYYDPPLDSKSLKTRLREVKGAIGYILGKNEMNYLDFKLVDKIKKTTINKTVKLQEKIIQEEEQEKIDLLPKVLNEELPKTKRKYLNPDKGNYVSYARAKTLGIIK